MCKDLKNTQNCLFLSLKSCLPKLSHCALTPSEWGSTQISNTSHNTVIKKGVYKIMHQDFSDDHQLHFQASRASFAPLTSPGSRRTLRSSRARWSRSSPRGGTSPQSWTGPRRRRRVSRRRTWGSLTGQRDTYYYYYWHLHDHTSRSSTEQQELLNLLDFAPEALISQILSFIYYLYNLKMYFIASCSGSPIWRTRPLSCRRVSSRSETPCPELWTPQTSYRWWDHKW